MSILIKRVKMPKCCEICPLNYDYFRCNALGEKFDDKEEIDFEMQRLSDCPLVEIPPHGRLIDADKTISIIKNTVKGWDFQDTWDGICNLIDDAQTIIESEEQEHEHE